MTEGGWGRLESRSVGRDVLRVLGEGSWADTGDDVGGGDGREEGNGWS